MAALLDYAITTEPFPLQASPAEGSVKPSNFTIVASNRNPEEPVTIEKIDITLPIGSNASDLTASAPKKEQAVDPTGWKCTDRTLGEGQAVFTFVPDPNHKVITDRGVSFLFNDIVINKETGVVRILVEENDVNLSVVQVTKFPYAWGSVSFGVDPAVIDAGKETTLDWHGPAKAVYEIEYFVLGARASKWIKDLSNDGTYTIALPATTNFTLHVYKNISGRKYHASDQKTCSVIPPPPSIDYFRPRGCTGTDCVIYSDEIEIEWNVLNAEPAQCQMTQEWTNPQGRKVTEVVPMVWKDKFVRLTPTEREVTYTLMVTRDKFEVTATVTATLLPPVPIGTIVPYGAKYAHRLPAGWLYCNGTEYLKKQYPELDAALENIYGSSGDKFRVPDLRGYFVRGYDDGRNIDRGRVMGSFQEDTFKSHVHEQIVTANKNSGGSAVRASFTGDEGGYSIYDQKANTKATGDGETRSKNMACYFVIYAGLPKTVRAKEPKKKKNKPASKKAAGKRRG